jgi:hypothetical protein
MTASSRAMAFMSALLAMSGGASLPSSMGGGLAIPRTSKRRNSHGNNRTTRLAGHRSKCKTHIARGAGTISAKADIQQLCNQRKYAEARELANEHEHQCGESLFAGAWWRFDETPADNC